MTDQQRAAMQAALKALENIHGERLKTGWPINVQEQMDALRAALAQQEQAKPAAWIDDSDHPRHISYLQSAAERRLYGPLRPLYEAPPQRKPLTDEQISNRLWEAEWPEVMLSNFVRAKLVALIRSVERAHEIEGEYE